MTGEFRACIDNEARHTAFERLDAEARDHSGRVSSYSAILARAMGMSVQDVVTVARGALLHEIGILAIPEAIVRKPAKLSADEQAIMREHSFHGHEMVRREKLAAEAEIVYSHHERFDGTGYPRGLKGEAIPLGARIVSIADTFDTFISDRPHRPEQAINAARIQVCHRSGNSFDPRLVELFASTPNEIWQSLRGTSQT